MADRVLPGPVDSTTTINEAVCINTRKIYDSCRDKDCIEDLRVYTTGASQQYIDCALSIRPKSAQLLFADVNTEEMTFNRGYYTVDVTYFYRVVGETFPGGNEVVGLSVFDKRVVLFGSEGSAKVFSSIPVTGLMNSGAFMPVAVVEAVDPIALNMKICERTPNCSCEPAVTRSIPQEILDEFGDTLVLQDMQRNVFVTLGQFSIIRLERDTQLVIPAYDYCMPDKECTGCSDDDPCTLFSRIQFPVEEFYPPDSVSHCEDYRAALNGSL